MPKRPTIAPAHSESNCNAASNTERSHKHDLSAQVDGAAEFLKLLASPPRLLLLCHVADDEVSVGELAERTGMRMPTVSQQLAHLRAQGIVLTRRDGTTIYYRRNCAVTQDIMNVLMKHFCCADTQG